MKNDGRKSGCYGEGVGGDGEEVELDQNTTREILKHFIKNFQVSLFLGKHNFLSVI